MFNSTRSKVFREMIFYRIADELAVYDNQLTSLEEYGSTSVTIGNIADKTGVEDCGIGIVLWV